MVVSYTNNYGFTDAYAHKPINNMTTNADGGGNGGGGTFFKMFEETEAEEIKKDTSLSSNPLDDLYPVQQGYYANENVIKDYIDNSLLLNTEQVACTNITQHLALKNNVKDTLKFLNLQAAKNMVNSKKRNYNYKHVSTDINNTNRQTDINDPVITDANFFEKKLSNPKVNFFITK